MSKITFKPGTDEIKEIFVHQDELEKKLPARNITQIKRFIDVAVSAYTVLERFDMANRETITQLELVVKVDFVAFDRRLHGAIHDYLADKNEEPLKQIVRPFTTLKDITELGDAETNYGLVIPSSSVTATEAFIADSVLTYFLSSSISDNYYHYVLKGSLTADYQGMEKMLDLGVRWATLALIVLACGEGDASIDEAKYCLGLARGYQDSCFILDGADEHDSGNETKTRATTWNIVVGKALRNIHCQENSGADVAIIGNRFWDKFKVNLPNGVKLEDRQTVTYGTERISKQNLLKVAKRYQDK